MNSTFKTIKVDGQDDLVALGLDTLEIVAGNNISITTDPNSDPKSLTISATTYVGSQGFTGSEGYTGSIGFTGSASDVPGFTGSQGFTGSIGFTGSASTIPGFVGSQGFTGSIGFTGSRGFQGDTGFVGSLGFTGSRGDQGFTGSQGIPGAFAALGYTGSQGDVGFTGSRGTPGTTGFTGSQGTTGFTGSQGTPGTSVKITGSVPSLNDLPFPYQGDAGDGYLAEDTGNLHVWTGALWVNVGAIRGPQGFTGSAGTGFAGSGGGIIGAIGNFDGGQPDSNYGGITPIDAGGVAA